MGYPCSALFALVCVLCCSLALGALCWHVLVQERWIELKGSPWLSIKLLCKKIRHMSWFFIQLLSNFFLLVKLLGTFGNKARTEKTFFAQNLLREQPRTHNTQHTMHHHHGGCCELQRWLAISWCHNESNNKQHVRVERHVTAASMICDTTAKILLSAVEISLDLRTKRSFYLLRTQHHQSPNRSAGRPSQHWESE